MAIPRPDRPLGRSRSQHGTGPGSAIGWSWADGAPKGFPRPLLDGIGEITRHVDAHEPLGQPTFMVIINWQYWYLFSAWEGIRPLPNIPNPSLSRFLSLSIFPCIMRISHSDHHGSAKPINNKPNPKSVRPRSPKREEKKKEETHGSPLGHEKWLLVAHERFAQTKNHFALSFHIHHICP